jgi:Tim44-like domain
MPCAEQDQVFLARFDYGLAREAARFDYRLARGTARFDAPPRRAALGPLSRPALHLAALVSALLPFAHALARPGGGETFSTPDDSGGGDGDGGNGVELVLFLLRLIFYYPKLGIPLALVAVVAFVVISRRSALSSWDTPHQPQLATRLRRRAPAAQDLQGAMARLRGLDPDFSRVLFEDFAYRLFASVQRARGDQSALEALSPYLEEGLRGALLRQDGAITDQVVVGALRLEALSLVEARGSARKQTPEGAGQVQITLRYEATLRLSRAGQISQLYAHERWTLSRGADVRTKPPGSYERLGCPNCAAPFRSSDSRRCDYCHQVVGDGRFNWVLTQREVVSERATLGGLGQHVEERGTDAPTVYAPDQEARWRALLARDPALDEQALEARVALIYRLLNQAYSAQALEPVRGLVSDGLYDYLRYWTEAYRAEGLRNVLEEMQIERSQRVKVVEDRYFDAVTLRLFARGLDYTVRADSGAHVSGERTRPRRYSEYWTLIRAADVRGPARAEPRCPSCAAPLQVSMAGTCAHCSAHITQGEFDWVLSKIEQDDVYDG